MKKKEKKTWTVSYFLRRTSHIQIELKIELDEYQSGTRMIVISKITWPYEFGVGIVLTSRHQKNANYVKWMWTSWIICEIKRVLLL